MKVLTAAEMREVDRKTSELGIPGIVLMENAAHRVVEFLVERFGPLKSHRVVVFCGKGEQRRRWTGDSSPALHALRLQVARYSAGVPPEQLTGDAAANFQMLVACGGRCQFEIEAHMQATTLIVDALLGTGLTGPARGKALEWIRAINAGFPEAKVLCVDVPSACRAIPASRWGVCSRRRHGDLTAPHYCHVLAPNCGRVGELRVAPIGSPASLYEDVKLSLIDPAMFRALLAPRDPAGNKGLYGHALVLAGSRGKTGAAAMSGMAALHAGAGLVTWLPQVPQFP